MQGLNKKLNEKEKKDQMLIFYFLGTLFLLSKNQKQKDQNKNKIKF
jgi:hypothetical protein